MIETIVALGVPQRFAKAVLIAVAFVFIVGLLALGKCSYDNLIINEHDSVRDTTIALDARTGEANAADERRADDDAITNQSDEVRNAVQALPDHSTSPRQHARACVILRQQAGAAGVPASAGC